MLLKNIVDEDFSNYKTCAMFLGFPFCDFKCEREANCIGMCQNCNLAKVPSVEIPVDVIINRYLANPLSHALVCGGLEPFDSWKDLSELIVEFRKKTSDPIVIYTGYKPEEINCALQFCKLFSNIIIKFGRFIPNGHSHYDEVLGVNLVSDNQYAERIS